MIQVNQPSLTEAASINTLSSNENESHAAPAYHTIQYETIFAIAANSSGQARCLYLAPASIRCCRASVHPDSEIRPHSANPRHRASVLQQETPLQVLASVSHSEI